MYSETGLILVSKRSVKLCKYKLDCIDQLDFYDTGFATMNTSREYIE